MLFLVVYSADQGIILSGYQIAEIGEASIPPEVLWLR